jgi:hypothetical protein
MCIYILWHVPQGNNTTEYKSNPTASTIRNTHCNHHNALLTSSSCVLSTWGVELWYQVKVARQKHSHNEVPLSHRRRVEGGGVILRDRRDQQKIEEAAMSHRPTESLCHTMRKGVADNVEDTHPSREEWGVVVSNVTVCSLSTAPFSEE